jgi:RNA polymerase sigma-70 factor (ECF subfamily)
MDKANLERIVSNEADEVLIGLIQQQDESALSVFYDRKSRFVYSLALSIVGAKADAEEITGEVFFRVWEKAANFDKAQGSVMAWLTTITRRLSIDRTRSRQYRSQTRETSIETADTGGALASQQADGERQIMQAVQTTEIAGALERLSESHREIIQLSYYEGLSHSKIAERLNTPLGTVKSRIRDAVIQLRQSLGVEV